jgi:hypothetical protein
MLEAICFQTADVLGAMRADADMSHMKVLRVDGGATKNNLLMQLQVGGCWQCFWLVGWSAGWVGGWEETARALHVLDIPNMVCAL